MLKKKEHSRGKKQSEGEKKVKTNNFLSPVFSYMMLSFAHYLVPLFTHVRNIFGSTNMYYLYLSILSFIHNQVIRVVCFCAYKKMNSIRQSYAIHCFCTFFQTDIFSLT